MQLIATTTMKPFTKRQHLTANAGNYAKIYVVITASLLLILVRISLSKFKCIRQGENQ